MMTARTGFLVLGMVLATSSTALAQAAGDAPADPLRPSAVTTQDVPAIPAERVARLRRYQMVRTAAFAGWSPDGRGILIQTRFGNAAQLHRVYEPGGRREQITFFDEPAGGRFIPQATDGAVLVVMSQGGNENDQIYLHDTAAYGTRLLTDGSSRNLLGPISHDGARMIVLSNRRNGRDTDLYATDPRSGSTELLMQADGQFWNAHDWSPDRGRLLMSRYVSINESYPAMFEVSSRSLAPIPPAGDEPYAVGDMAFTPDGKSAWLSSDARGEYLELGRIELSGRTYQWLTSDLKWDVDELEVDPASGRLAFAINEDGASRLFLQDGDERRPLDVPLGVVSGLEFSPDGAQLGFTLARPDAPADAFSLRLETGELVQWTFSETGGLNPADFVRPERIEFPSFDGRQIPAWYFRPRAASREHRAGVVIQIHGGPESQYRPLFSPAIQHQVSELGLAVICPNVRGSAGYGKTYLKLDNAELRQDSIRDIGALLDWIAGREELDPARVAVTGGSYGGFMVLASLANYPDRLRAGVDIVGIASLVTFLERTSPYRQDLRRAEYGDERDPEIRKFLEQVSPLAKADQIRSALLVAHGVNDPRVPFSEAQQIAERVRAAGREVWTVYAQNEGHGFAKKDNRDYVLAVEAMFLDRHLNGAE